MANDIVKAKFDVERRLEDFLDQMREEVEECFWDDFDEDVLKDGIDEGELQEQFFDAVHSYLSIYKK